MNLVLLLFGMLVGVAPNAACLAVVALVTVGAAVFGVVWALVAGCEWITALITSRFARIFQVGDEAERAGGSRAPATSARHNRWENRL